MITAPRQGINSQRKAFLSGLFDLYLPAELYTTDAQLTGMKAKVTYHERSAEDSTFVPSTITPISIRLRDTIFNMDNMEDSTFVPSVITPISLRLKDVITNMDGVEDSTFVPSTITPISLTLREVVINQPYEETLTGPQIRVLNLKFGN